MPIRTWIGTTSASNVASNWSPSGTPISTDDLIFNNSANCALLANITVNSINFTGYTGTFSGTNSITIAGSDTGTATGNSLVFSTTMTQSWTGNILFNSSVGGYITLNGKSLNATVTFNNATGVWEVQDTFNHTGANFIITAGSVTLKANLISTGTLTLTAGTLTVLNGSNITIGSFSSANTNVRTVNMGCGTWTLLNAGTSWNLTTSTNMTLNAEQSRIVSVNSSTTTVTFGGGNLNYYTFEIARGSSTAGTNISGNNTFVNFIDNTSTGAKTIQFTTPGTNSFYRFFVKGTAGNLIQVTRGISATYTLQKLGREYVFETNYITATAGLNWTFSPSNTWYIGPNSLTGSTVGGIPSNPPTAQSLLGAGGVG